MEHPEGNPSSDTTRATERYSQTSTTASPPYVSAGQYQAYRYIPSSGSRSPSGPPLAALRPSPLGHHGRGGLQYPPPTRQPYEIHHPLAYSATLGDQPIYSTAGSWSGFPAASEGMLLPPTSTYLTSSYGTSGPWSSPPHISYSGDSSPTAWSMPTSAGLSTSTYAPSDDFADSSSSSSDTEFSRGISINHGLAVQQAPEYKCNLCQKAYGRLNNLRTHQERRHNPNARRYICEWPQCTSHFSRPQDLARHQDSAHRNVRHQCPVCKRDFRRKDSLRRHRESSNSCQANSRSRRGRR